MKRILSIFFLCIKQKDYAILRRVIKDVICSIRYLNYLSLQQLYFKYAIYEKVFNDAGRYPIREDEIKILQNAIF